MLCVWQDGSKGDVILPILWRKDRKSLRAAAFQKDRPFKL